VSTQQEQQAILASALADQLPAAWDALLNIDDLESSLPAYVAGVTALVRKYATTSGAVAARYYAAERDASGIAGRVTVPIAPLPNLDEMDTGIRWATKGLWSEAPDVESAQSLVQGVAERGVLDTGRNTLLDAIKADRKAKGWARVIEPGACSFCILLATRGAVYRAHSFTNANFKFSGPGAFKAHNHCRCTLEPVFGEYEASAEVRQWQATYKQVAKTNSGRGARRAFRQAVESARAQ
jgi:hypothetical protein